MKNKIFAISDLHLCNDNTKPMDIFGGAWTGYFDKIQTDWIKQVGENDIVLIPGDISWAMKMDDAIIDLKKISDLPGKKVILRGNHDYWWSAISKIREELKKISKPNKEIFAIQNDVIKIDDVIICGSRGWILPENFTDSNDEKIYEREKLRLRLSLDTMKRIKKEGDRVIVIMHYPPLNNELQNSEFCDILKEYNIDKVVFGHVHTKGKYKDLCFKLDDINYYLTSCDLVDNKLILID